MKTYIRFKQHKNRLQNLKQIEVERQQKYRLGTISNIKLFGGGGGGGGWRGGGFNRFYRRLTSPASSAVVHTLIVSQLVVRSWFVIESTRTNK